MSIKLILTAKCDKCFSVLGEAQDVGSLDGYKNARRYLARIFKREHVMIDEKMYSLTKHLCRHCADRI